MRNNDKEIWPDRHEKEAYMNFQALDKEASAQKCELCLNIFMLVLVEEGIWWNTSLIS